MYYYLVVSCQNPKCSKDRILISFGDKRPSPLISVTVPNPFMLTCSACEKEYDYSSSYRKLIESGVAPPPGFKDLIAFNSKV
jgi:hypothetical protein